MTNPRSNEVATTETRAGRVRTARLAVAAAVATCLLVPGSAGAAKGGGGSPAGTVYYRSYDVLYKMNADGSGKTSLPVVGNNSTPSRLLHGGKRWFLQTYYYDSLVAAREDGTASVQLIDDPPSPTWYWDIRTPAQWAPDEDATSATISFTARQRYVSDGASVPGSSGLYTAKLLFDGAGDVIGLEEQPEFRVSVGVIYPGGINEIPDTDSAPSWSPDMSRVVVDRSSLTGSVGHDLRIIDLGTGASTTLVSDATYGLDDPIWSPSGTAIAFRFHKSLQKISPNGSGRQTLTSETKPNSQLFEPHWAPDSAYLVYGRTEGQFPNAIFDIYRISSSGGSKTNLTSDMAQQPVAIGWR